MDPDTIFMSIITFAFTRVHKSDWWVRKFFLLASPNVFCFILGRQPFVKIEDVLVNVRRREKFVMYLMLFLQSRPFTWSCVCAVESSSRRSGCWRRSTTATRWSAESKFQKRIARRLFLTLLQEFVVAPTQEPKKLISSDYKKFYTQNVLSKRFWANDLFFTQKYFYPENHLNSTFCEQKCILGDSKLAISQKWKSNNAWYSVEKHSCFGHKSLAMYGTFISGTIRWLYMFHRSAVLTPKIWMILLQTVKHGEFAKLLQNMLLHREFTATSGEEGWKIYQYCSGMQLCTMFWLLK